MELGVIIVFVIGLALGGVGGFFVGSGRTIEVSNSQHTEVTTTTIQNQAQVTIVEGRNIEKVQFHLTNFLSRKELEAWLNTLDPFQLANCEIIPEKALFQTHYLVIYPLYVEGVVTNTSRVVLTNTSNTTQMRIK